MTHIEATAENYRQTFRGPGNHISSMNIKKSFEDGADYMLEKACQWIQKEVLEDYEGVIWSDIVKDFRKAMEE